MQFFVPGANDPHQAKCTYSNFQATVGRRHGVLKGTRIFRLSFRHDGRRCTVAVGDSFQLKHGQPVLAIFEGSDYYVCTGACAQAEPETFVVPRGDNIEVETFH